MTIFRDSNGQWIPITETPSDEEDSLGNKDGKPSGSNRNYESYDAGQTA